MYKYARIFVYYARNKQEKKTFVLIKIVLKKVQVAPRKRRVSRN